MYVTFASGFGRGLASTTSGIVTATPAAINAPWNSMLAAVLPVLRFRVARDSNRVANIVFFACVQVGTHLTRDDTTRTLALHDVALNPDPHLHDVSLNDR